MATRSSNALRRGTTPASLPLASSNLSSSKSNDDSRTSSSSGVGGGGPSSYLTKATISLEEWERRTPLGETQIRSITKVTKLNESGKKPVPLKFAEEPGTPTIAGPAQRLLQQKQKDGTPIPSRPSTPSSQSPAATGSARRAEDALLHPKNPIQTPQQFYDWFALIDRSVAHSQEAHYRAHVASLEDHLSVCDMLLARIDEVDREVDGMMEGWRGVEEGGKSLKGACERLLEERDALVELVEDIGGHLEYFQELEHATRMLNYPGESLIFQADFLYMVERVDICIDFLKVHRHYREAEVYLLRFQQCMTRAMTLIKMNFVGSLRALSAEISKRLSEDISPTAQHHLLYTRFKSVSTKIAPLLGELERRAQSYPDELSALLAECHTAFLSARRNLLIPIVVEEIRGLDPGRSELVELTREGCGYLKGMCGDEWGLWREFFGTGEAALYQYLETLCDLLYDDLRPRILHEPRLTVLCEVCTVLQALMVLDTTTSSSSGFTTESSSSASSTASASATDSDSDSDEETDDHPFSTQPKSRRARRHRHRRHRSDELTVPAPPSPTLSHSHSHSHSQKPNTARISKRLHIAHLLKMVLQDAQTRLFFKAQAVIQSEIRHFVPREEDLMWPNVLVASANRQNKNNGNELVEKESTNRIFQGPGQGRGRGRGQETWYPTLKKTVWVLTQLRDFVKPAIFEDIAQEALSYCRLSLITASENIAVRVTTTPESNSNNTSKLDAALFLVRHMLILKEVWNSLEELRVKEEGMGMGMTSSASAGLGMGKSEKPPGLGSSISRGLDFGVISASSSGGVTETLTNMLSKTTSLLPEGLFASLGVTRGVESDMRGVKLDIDHTLRKACEDAIAACSAPVCDALDVWTENHRSVNATSSPSASGSTSTSTNTPAPAPLKPNASSQSPPKEEDNLHTVHLHFLESIQRDLRSGVARIRLYLADNDDDRDNNERTVRVLVEHVMERVAGSYERWTDVVGRTGAGESRGGGPSRGGSGESGSGKVEILTSARLREMLRDVCGGSSNSSLSLSLSGGHGRV